MPERIPATAAARRQPELIRQADHATLEAALRAGRDTLLALFDGFQNALGTDGLHIGFDPVLNLPLWELGHIGWFEEHWLARNRERRRGVACDPAAAARTPSLRADADALYDSSKVPHAMRWRLELPTPAATRAYLARVRETTLELLHEASGGAADSDDDGFYFFRLVLLHEDMHREAWHFMAQHLAIDLGPAMCTGEPTGRQRTEGEWQVPAGRRSLGRPAAARGFAFDNELAGHDCLIDAFTIDRSAVSWARYLPFVEDGGYRTRACWSDAGWAWRTDRQRQQPKHLRRGGDGWQQNRFGRWQPLDRDAAAVHLSAHEADAWCRWAGRRLPSEAEWETAALLAGRHAGGGGRRVRDVGVGSDDPVGAGGGSCKAEVGAESAVDAAFEWGEVWEWTASAFAPYPGFIAHPYREYSQPWFDGRPVLRGGSFATSPHLLHPRFRNFFPADRDDVFAGFRSCAARGAQPAVAASTRSEV